MIKSIDYASIITEDLMEYGAESKYQELIAQNIVPFRDEQCEIVPFEPIGHVRRPSFAIFKDKFANMKNELNELFASNEYNLADPEVFAIVKKYFDMLDCNKTVQTAAKKQWKDLFNRIVANPTVEDCIEFDRFATGSEDTELIIAAADVDTKARKLFGDDYLVKNVQSEPENNQSKVQEIKNAPGIIDDFDA